LVASLTAALKLVLQAESVPGTAVPADDFKAHKPLDSDPAVFSEDVRELVPERPFGLKKPTEVANKGRAYLRLYPLKALPMIKTPLEARLVASKGLRPMGTRLSGWDAGRNVFGAVVYEGPFDGKLYRFTQLFLNKELWGVDAQALYAPRLKGLMTEDYPGFIASSYVEQMFTETLSNYLQFAQKTLELPMPLQVEAGLTGIKGYAIAVENGLTGRVLADRVPWNGSVPSYDIRPHEILKPFFDYMWAECGLVRPDKFQKALEQSFS